jgi:hypothetical protein
MTTPTTEQGWDEVTPVLHDDGAGFSINFTMDHGSEDLSWGGSFHARFGEGGLPVIDSARLHDELVVAVMSFAHQVFPQHVPDFA